MQIFHGIFCCSSNAVHDLSPFSTCKKLSQLALRRNNVSSMGEVLHLKDLSCLKILWLKDNPVEKEDNYRLKVIKLLPQLQKLDNRGQLLKYLFSQMFCQIILSEKSSNSA